MTARQIRMAAYAVAIASVPLFVLFLAAGRLWIGAAFVPVAISALVAAAGRRETAEHERNTRGKNLWVCHVCGFQTWQAWHVRDEVASRCPQCGGGQLELVA